MANPKYTPQGSAIDPDATQYTAQGSAIDPDATQYTAQGSAIDPDATQYTAQGSAIDPDATQYTAQGSAIDPEAVSGKPVSKPVAAKPKVAAKGAEGELIVQGDGTVLKRYRQGLRCNATVLKLVKGMTGKGYVADVLDYGTKSFDGVSCDFELMRYYPLGSASKYDLKGNADAITRIVAKIALSLDACHKRGFIHKDVKPANILIADKGTWDCVLCDFGFADILEGGKVSTIQNRTPVYAAPEVYDPANTAVISGHTYCTLTPASDFYSLGMTALSLWSGEQALLAREAQLAIEKRNDKIKVGNDIPDPLNRIIRGLLVKDPAHRWGLNEIKRTLKGEDVKVYEGAGMEIVFNGEKGLVAHSPQELAALMYKDVKLARGYLYSGQVSKWLEKRPELKLEIDRIVEKDFPKDEMSGLMCSLHILNPLYDLNMHLPDHPDYAMTGQSIGKLLNDAYNIYYGRFDGDIDKAIKEFDSDCAAKINGSAIFVRLVKCFKGYSEKNYLVWFLSHKGSRFANQLSWLKYCLDFDSRDNKKKAGPKDPEYLQQTAMMKTIAGFGYKPTYDCSKVKGLRGYLAVQYHENPRADLKPKYSYEKLLEQYLEEFRKYCPTSREVMRYDEARIIALDTADKAKGGGKSLYVRDWIQRILSIVLVLAPAIFLVISVINLVSKYPEVDVSGVSFGWVFAIIGLVLGIVAAFVFDADSLLFPLITGFVAALVLFVVVKMLGGYVFWIYGFVVLAVIILCAIKSISLTNAGNIKKMQGNPGFMELTLEPLYYAFNDEESFTSTLSVYVDQRSIDLFKYNLSDRRKTIIIFAGLLWALVVAQVFINKWTDAPDAKGGIQIVKRERGIIHEEVQAENQTEEEVGNE